MREGAQKKAVEQVMSAQQGVLPSGASPTGA